MAIVAPERHRARPVAARRLAGRVALEVVAQQRGRARIAAAGRAGGAARRPRSAGCLRCLRRAVPVPAVPCRRGAAVPAAPAPRRCRCPRCRCPRRPRRRCPRRLGRSARRPPLALPPPPPAPVVAGLPEQRHAATSSDTVKIPSRPGCLRIPSSLTCPTDARPLLFGIGRRRHATAASASSSATTAVRPPRGALPTSQPQPSAACGVREASLPPASGTTPASGTSVVDTRARDAQADRAAGQRAALAVGRRRADADALGVAQAGRHAAGLGVAGGAGQQVHLVARAVGRLASRDLARSARRRAGRGRQLADAERAHGARHAHAARIAGRAVGLVLGGAAARARVADADRARAVERRAVLGHARADAVRAGARA